MFWYEYLLFSISLGLILAKEDPAKQTEHFNRSPLILTYYNDFYLYPQKGGINDDQDQEYFYSKEQDGQYFCPIEENNRKTRSETTSIENIQRLYCLVSVKFKKGEEKACKKEVKPIIIEKKLHLGQPEYCRTKYRQIYKFGYQICANKSKTKKKWYLAADEIEEANKQFSSTYEICYDHSTNQVMYTKHVIRSPYILRNLRLDRERAQHDFSEKYSTETYGITNLDKLSITLSAYESQNPNPEDREYKLQRLVPMEDFALGHWIKTTLHMINYSLQHRSKVPLWDAMNSYVNLRLIKLYAEISTVKIYTGTWGELLNKSSRPVYLRNEKEVAITIPKIWWKLLYSTQKRRAIVIIMHNEDGMEKKCQKNENACDVTKWNIKRGIDESEFEKNVYCCSVSIASTFIPTINDLVIGEPDGILKID